MSVITLQFGQAGNSIGDSLYSHIHDELTATPDSDPYHSQTLHQWFHATAVGGWEPRSVLVDTERKALDARSTLPFAFRHVVAGASGGSANNWAFGYEQGALLLPAVAEAVRAEAERCDLLASFLTLLGAAGGTGGGAGARAAEWLRDEFPRKTMVHAPVLPHRRGEIAVQSYNALLALPRLLAAGDACLALENEARGAAAARQLLALYQPAGGAPAAHFLAALCTLPALRLLQARSAAGAGWRPVFGALARQARAEHARPRAAAAGAVCRGAGGAREAELALAEAVAAVRWLPRAEALRVQHVGRRFMGAECHAVLATNSNAVAGPLEVILEDARCLFRYGAYVHHYKRYGVDEGVFEHSFECFRRILDNYKNL